MKVYVHHDKNVLPVVVKDQQSVGALEASVAQSLGVKSVKLSKFCKGSELNSDVKVSSFFEPFDDVWVAKVEESKEVLTHLPPPAALQYVSLSKYSFYEYDSNWVRVEVPFPDIANHDKAKISCEFDVNSFVLKIAEFKVKNYQFSVMRLQCNIQNQLCKYSVLKDKIRIGLRKVKDTDNWFSLFKTKTIGGDD